jgi:hypothetical protein
MNGASSVVDGRNCLVAGCVERMLGHLEQGYRPPTVIVHWAGHIDAVPIAHSQHTSWDTAQHSS